MEDVGGAAPKLKEKEGLLCPCVLLIVVRAAPPAAAPNGLGALDCVEDAPVVPNAVVPPVAPNEKADFGAAALDELAVFPPNALVLGGAPAGVVENALKPAGLLGVVVDTLFVIDEPPNALEPAGVVDEVGAPKPKAAGVLAPAGAVEEVVV